MKTIDITLASPAVAQLVERALTSSLTGLLNAQEIRAVQEVRDTIKTARERATFARHPLSGFGGVP